MMSLEQQINAVENTILDYELRITNCKDTTEREYLIQKELHLRRKEEQVRDKELLLLRAQQTTGKRIAPFAHIQKL